MTKKIFAVALLSFVTGVCSGVEPPVAGNIGDVLTTEPEEKTVDRVAKPDSVRAGAAGWGGGSTSAPLPDVCLMDPSLKGCSEDWWKKEDEGS